MTATSEQEQLRYIASQAADARVNVEIETEGMTLNIGPQHPATHGTLRIIAKLDGEQVIVAEPVMGYMHRGYEKLAEEGYQRNVVAYRAVSEVTRSAASASSMKVESSRARRIVLVPAARTLAACIDCRRSPKRAKQSIARRRASIANSPLLVRPSASRTVSRIRSMMTSCPCRSSPTIM